MPSLIVTGNPDQIITLSTTGFRYLTKPFSMNLLLGRRSELVRRLYRRGSGQARSQTS